MKESLKIMSLKMNAYGLSFLIGQGVFTIFTALLISITYLIRGDLKANMLFVFFIIALFYGIILINFSLVLTTVF